MSNLQNQENYEKNNGLILKKIKSDCIELKEIKLELLNSTNKDGIEKIKIVGNNGEKTIINDKLIQEERKNFYAAYLNYSVIIGRWKYNNDGNNKFLELTIPPGKEFLIEHIQKIRFFNPSLEILLMSKGPAISEFTGRIRIDYDSQGERNQSYYIECQQALFGTKFERLNGGWGKLIEDRGTEIIVPFDSLEDLNQDKPLFIKIRNYVDFHKETFQSYYCDYRMVSFIYNGKELE